MMMIGYVIIYYDFMYKSAEARNVALSTHVPLPIALIWAVCLPASNFTPHSDARES